MSNYSDSQFVKHPNTPWYKALKMIPVKSRVLDIGCSSGNFGQVLTKEKQCIVDGIELDYGDAKKAEGVLNRVHILNIETDDISMLTDAAYDIIYFGDVIEHLVDPVKALEKIKVKLAPAGSIVFSIPNMAHISVSIMLMEGRFQYGKTGLLDKTHLHYYDLDEIKRVFAEAGFIISELDWVRRDVPTELLKRQLKKIGLTPNAEFIKKSKDLERAAYQFIGKAELSLKKTKPTQLPTVSPPIDEFEKYLDEVRQEYKVIINEAESRVKQLQEEAKQLREDLISLNNSTSWKITKPLRAGSSAVGKLKKRGRFKLLTQIVNFFLPHGSRTRAYVARQKARVKLSRAFAFDKSQYNIYRNTYYRSQIVPKVSEVVRFSIIVPCFNTSAFYLNQLLDSVYAQKYGNWELILVDASDIDKRSNQIKLLSQNDTRIKYLKVTNKGIAINTNAGIEVASGGYVCFLDHDDMLDPRALTDSALVISKHPEADLIYSDEDKIDDSGESYSNPHYKPGFSIDLLHSVNYITHFVVARTDLVREIGGIRSGFDGAQDYDFLLRMVDKTKHIYHIPKVLYHWRQAVGSTSRDFSLKKNVTAAGVKALNDHFKRNTIKTSAYALKNRPGFYGATYDLSNAARAIYIVAPDDESQKIKNYIKKSYVKLVNTNKMKVDVHVVTSVDEVDTDLYEYVLLVQGRIVPTEKDSSLNSLFGIVENGSQYSSIKLITNNKIYDSGYIKQEYGFMPLFHGLDPALPMHFGSSEWNRNVDGLSNLLVCLSTKDITSLKSTGLITARGKNITVFGQFQYHIFNPIEPAKQGFIANTGYFNPNFANGSEPHVFIMDDIIDHIKVKK